MRPPLRPPLLMLASLLLLLGACGPTERERVEAIYTTATTNIPGAQAAIVRDWTAKAITLDACINLGHERLEQGQPGAAAFAMAVLNAAAELEGQIEKAGVTEFYWFRIGTLAGAGAADAYNSGDITSARALVLAGPRRWQGENYWRLHPDHDAMASLIMHKAGESDAAVRRLRERPDLDDHALAVLNQIDAYRRAMEAEKARKK